VRCTLRHITQRTPLGIIRKSALWNLCRARHKFHGCALAAYLDQAAEQQGWPDSEATKRRANDYYEQALREKNAAKAAPRARP
jgi:hypothetical protein